jgi:hypothetical protein
LRKKLSGLRIAQKMIWPAKLRKKSDLSADNSGVDHPCLRYESLLSLEWYSLIMKRDVSAALHAQTSPDLASRPRTHTLLADSMR